MRGPAGRLRGYGFVIAAYVIFGSIGALANYASAPESMLLVLRFAIAASSSRCSSRDPACCAS